MKSITRGTLLFVTGIVFVVGLIVIFTKKTEEQKMRIGVIAPLTGNRADAGEYMKNVLTLIQHEFKTDKSVQINFILEDDRYDNKSAVSAIEKLLTIDKVHYIVGPYGSSQVLAVAPNAEQAHTILITPGGQADAISDSGEYIFRLIHNAQQEAPVFARFITDKMQSDTLFMITIKNEFANSYLEIIRPIFAQMHKKIEVIDQFDPSNTDFKIQLLKLKGKNPTDVFPIAAPKQMGTILKQAHELGIAAQFYHIGVEGPELIGIAGSSADGILYPYSYDGQNPDKNVQKFVLAYQKQFGKEPDAVAANTYDAIQLLRMCIENVGNAPDRVKDCLYRTRDYHGAGGTFSIDAKGDAEKTIFIKTVKNLSQ